MERFCFKKILIEKNNIYIVVKLAEMPGVTRGNLEIISNIKR